MRKISIKKGFTLLEVIITAALLSIVLASVSPIIQSNLKTLYETQSKNDLQGEAYKCIENFTKKALEAKKIEEVSSNPSNPSLSSLMDKSTEQSISYIKFITGEDKTYIFVYDSSSKVLKYGDSDADFTNGTERDVAKDIKNFTLTPLDTNGNLTEFSKCSGLKIKVEFSKDLVNSYVISSEVRFRNFGQN